MKQLCYVQHGLFSIYLIREQNCCCCCKFTLLKCWIIRNTDHFPSKSWMILVWYVLHIFLKFLVFSALQLRSWYDLSTIFIRATLINLMGTPGSNVPISKYGIFGEFLNSESFIIKFWLETYNISIQKNHQSCSNNVFNLKINLKVWCLFKTTPTCNIFSYLLIKYAIEYIKC